MASVAPQVLCQHPVSGRGDRGRLWAVPHAPRSMLWTSRTGVDVDLSSFTKADVSRDLLRSADARIARALEAAGIQMRRKHSMAQVCPITGTTKNLECWENKKILPSMQKQQTSQILNALKCYIDTNKIYTQMIVFSAGWVPLTELRTRVRLLSKQIKELRLDVEKKYGCDIFYRNIEFTEHKIEDGTVMCNLHSHALIDMPYIGSKDEYDSFLNTLRLGIDKGYVHISPLDKVNEACKYAFKPIVDFEDDAIVELYHQTYRLNFYQPLGGFRVWLRQFDASEEVTADGEVVKIPARKLVQLSDSDGELEWVAIPRSGDIAVPDVPDDSELPPPVNCVVGVQAPAPWTGPRLMPALLVLNFQPEVGRDPVATLCAGKYGLSQFVNRLRAVHNARQPFDAWAPLVASEVPDSPSALSAYADLICSTVVDFGGQSYLVARDVAPDAKRRLGDGAHKHVSSSLTPRSGFSSASKGSKGGGVPISASGRPQHPRLPGTVRRLVAPP